MNLKNIIITSIEEELQIEIEDEDLLDKIENLATEILSYAEEECEYKESEDDEPVDYYADMDSFSDEE